MSRADPLLVTVLLADPSLPDASKHEARFRDEDLEAMRRMRAAFQSLPDYAFTFEDRHGSLLESLRTQPPRFVVNFCDTGYRNEALLEWHIPAYLELLGIPYSGAHPAAMAICYDKALVCAEAAALGIPVPEARYVTGTDEAGRLALDFPLLIKPNHGDGSVGITQHAVVRDAAAARAYLDYLARELPGRDLLLQEYLPGPEYSVGLIGNPDDGFTELPVLEVDFSGLPDGLEPILSFESKAVPDSPYWSDIGFREARLDAAERERMVDISRRLFRRFGLRDYGRFDFRADGAGRIKLMEVNPNPAWGYDGKLALMAGMAEIPYPRMLELILLAALRRTGTAPTG